MLRELLGPSGLLLSTSPLEALLEQKAGPQGSQVECSESTIPHTSLRILDCISELPEPGDSKQAGETLPVSFVKEKALGT